MRVASTTCSRVRLRARRAFLSCWPMDSGMAGKKTSPVPLEVGPVMVSGVDRILGFGCRLGLPGGGLAFGGLGFWYLLRLDRQTGFGFAFPVHVDLDLGNEIHGEADPDGMFAQGPQRLHIQLLTFQGISGFFLDDLHDILGSDRSIELPRLAGACTEAHLNFGKPCCNGTHFLVQEGAAL